MGFIIYGPTVISGTNLIDIAPNAQLAQCAIVEVLNDSSFGLNLVLPGNIQDFLPPQQAKFFASEEWYGQDILVTPMQVLSGSFTGLPQQITILGYKHGEPTPPAGTTIDMGKVVIVANTVSTVGGVATSIDNMGNVPNTPIVTAQDTVAATPAVEIDNSGNIKIGSVISGNLFKILQTIAGATGGTTEVLLGTGQNNNIVESRDLIQADAGVTLTGGTLTFLAGTCSRMTFGNGVTGAGGSVVVNHGLGTTPDAVIVNGFNSINNDWGANSVGATSFTAVNSAGTAKTFAWIALKA